MERKSILERGNVPAGEYQGGDAMAEALIALVYCVSLAAALFLPETRAKALPA
jgi:hypothetical protein